MTETLHENHQRAGEAREALSAVRTEVAKAVVGQDAAVSGLLVALLSGGHVLMEGVPGVAKTLLVRTLATALAVDTKRVQFTPDLMPGDITGSMVIEGGGTDLTFREGPLFTNLLLADEINRTPPKTQSALLEAMEERQVTIGDVTEKLPDPFLVMATQNPIEQEGTYPLPEAQVDRFLLKVKVDYPKKEEERQVLDLMLGGAVPAVSKVLPAEAIHRLTQRMREVYLDERIRDYVVALVLATRRPREIGLPELAHFIGFGASPRATLAFSEAGRAMAFLRGRGYVVPEDIKEIAKDVLRHRLILTFEAEAENVTAETVIDRILEKVEVP